MITYTRKNVSLITACLTLIIFIIFHLWCLPNLSNNMFFSKQIYSKSIASQPQSNENQYLKDNSNFLLEMQNRNSNVFQTENSGIYLNSNNLVSVVQRKENNSEEQTKKQNTQTTKQESKTQREVLKENKENKWRIQIPKINLDAHIKEGTSAGVMLQAVGHFEETSKWNGNVGLAAHNRGYQCNFFQKIKNLKIGDEIIYKTTNGKKVYRVQTNKVIKETDWSYLENTKDNRITLITCEENRKEYRRCVQAVEIKNM